MKPALKNIIKAGLLFAAVGATLALIAPVIGMALGIVGGATTYGAAASALGHTANPLWLGSFFGAFGAIDTGMRPVFDKIFGESKKTQAAVADSSRVIIALNPTVEKTQEPNVASAKYRETIEAERNAIKAENAVTL